VHERLEEIAQELEWHVAVRALGEEAVDAQIVVRRLDRRLGDAARDAVGERERQRRRDARGAFELAAELQRAVLDRQQVAEAVHLARAWRGGRAGLGLVGGGAFLRRLVALGGDDRHGRDVRAR